ncbi:hypothetical protein [Streptosporangium sp. NPDC000396]|uniref:hypothetical protein n=1 Tax=Streptosporangium sp. NPDC000396 TaxID=3366185 RepID=UPI0036A2EA48
MATSLMLPCGAHAARSGGGRRAAGGGRRRAGYGGDRAALIYQHATRDADQKIADALSARVEVERKKDRDGDDDGMAVLVPMS